MGQADARIGYRTRAMPRKAGVRKQERPPMADCGGTESSEQAACQLAVPVPIRQRDGPGTEGRRSQPQSSTTRPGTTSKCRRFDVASRAPAASAIDAMTRSKSSTGVPSV